MKWLLLGLAGWAAGCVGFVAVWAVFWVSDQTDGDDPFGDETDDEP